jgi:hypothetical protein
MSTTKTAHGSRTIWATSSGVTVPTSPDPYAPGIVLLRGQYITLTPEQVELTKDRFGQSWLDQTAEQQIARFGEQRWAEGLPPDGILIGGDDVAAVAAQRAEAERQLKFQPDEELRERAAQRIRETYGPSTASNQRTIQR